MGETNLSGEMDRILSVLKEKNPDLISTTKVRTAWDQSIDDETKKHTSGIFIVPNTNASEIIVYVDNSIRAADLNMQSELLRLKLNMLLSSENENTNEHNLDISDEEEELSMFEEGEKEWVTKLTFKVSRDGYAKKDVRLSTAEQMEEDEFKSRIEPIELTQDEMRRLEEAAAGIEDSSLRKKVVEVAKADLELKKAIELIKHPES